MYRACIVVADASRARLFTFERSHEVEGVKEEMIEHRDLVDLARRQRPAELFSESRPGSSRTGGLQYTFDDHRDAHVAALDAAFARSIADELSKLVRTTHVDKLIICASPRVLGALRRAREGLPEIHVDEMARNLVELTPSSLRARLADYGFLPAPPARPRA
jgi:protein required for attachment to host cells